MRNYTETAVFGRPIFAVFMLSFFPSFFRYGSGTPFLNENIHLVKSLTDDTLSRPRSLVVLISDGKS
jgi:hypothetical protein